MNRRAFLCGTMSVAFSPRLAAGTEPRKQFRIGYLSPGSMTSHGPLFLIFRQVLGDLGYGEGRDITIEYRWAEGRQDVLDVFARELVQLHVDLIITSGTPAAFAAKRASQTVPIITVGVGDPVHSGLVASFAQPGGNVTGFSVLSTEIVAKRLQLLGEVVPVSRVGVVWNPNNQSVVLTVRELEERAGSLRAGLHSLEVRSADDIQEAFNTAARLGVGALVVVEDPLTVVQRKLITTLAAEKRLPAIYGHKAFMDAGGLMSYAADYADLYRRAALLTDRIFKGGQPADLPFEQATKLDLVINLKTARSLALTIPPSLLLRADQVIE